MNNAVKDMSDSIEKVNNDFIDWADEETTGLE
jgi:hypothetical protein